MSAPAPKNDGEYARKLALAILSTLENKGLLTRFDVDTILHAAHRAASAPASPAQNPAHTRPAPTPTVSVIDHAPRIAPPTTGPAALSTSWVKKDSLPVTPPPPESASTNVPEAVPNPSGVVVLSADEGAAPDPLDETPINPATRPPGPGDALESVTILPRPAKARAASASAADPQPKAPSEGTAKEPEPKATEAPKSADPKAKAPQPLVIDINLE